MLPAALPRFTHDLKARFNLIKSYPISSVANSFIQQFSEISEIAKIFTKQGLKMADIWSI